VNLIKNKNSKLYLLILVSLLTIFCFIYTINTPVQEKTSPVYDDEFLIPKKSDPNAFISVWNTALTSPGSSSSNQVKLPLVSTGTYNFLVKWGSAGNLIMEEID